MNALISKYRLLSILLVFIGYCHSMIFAQYTPTNPTTKQKKWRSSQLDFGLGIDNDRYYRMSLNDILSSAENPASVQRDLQDFGEEVATTTAGLALYVHQNFQLFSKAQNEFRTDWLLQLGVGMHSPKESMVSYRNKDIDSSIIFCNRRGEFTFEGAYIKQGYWGKRQQFLWYFGGGLNTSLSFTNEVIVLEGQYFEKSAHPSTQQRLDENVARYLAKPMAVARLYIPYGVHAVLNDKWTLGFDARRGLGVQSVFGGSTNFISRTGTFAIGMRRML